MARHVSALSSMATRGLLSMLGMAWGGQADMNAAGGVEAAKRIREGEAVDVLVLAAAAMEKLERDGFILQGSLVAIGVSTIAAAVRQGDVPPGLSDALALQRAILTAGRVGYSTGPSGEHLLRLLDQWGLRAELGKRIVQAPPGIPVGRLLVEGAVDLAFQQRSELMDIPGIVLAFPLPSGTEFDTVFTAGIVRSCPRPEVARCFIDFLASPQNDHIKRCYGMEPA